jgi:hypothetical protein
MAQVTITQLPQAGALTGNESVPIVQNGVTVQTTTSAISGAGALNYPFLTVSQTAGLTQSRYLSTNGGLSLTDGGAQGTLQVNLIGAAMSLNSSPVGIQVKTGTNTVTAREIEVGAGLGITNGTGVAGNPTVALGTFLQNLVSQTGTGILAIQSGSPAKIDILGVTSQTSITNGDGAGDVTIALADNAILPGQGSVTLPQGTTVQRVNNIGAIRYNTTFSQFEGYTNTGWNQFSLTGGVTSFSAGATGFSPNTDTTGAVTLDGVLNPAHGGTGVDNGSSTITLTGDILTGGSITTAGTINTAGNFTTAGAFSLTLTSTANTNVTLPNSGTLATLSGSETLTNKTISGASNTLTNIGNASLTNSAITIGSTSVSLGGTLSTLAGVSISGSTNTLSNIANSSLTNSSITLGTTTIALGATSLAPAGLTSVTVTQDPTTAFQLATKQYVDSLAASGIHYHDPVYVESPNTAGNLNATYNQPGGAGVGVGATLTNAGTQVALTIDGVLMTVGKRVLIYNQTNQFENGVYTVTTVGNGSTNWVLTRATDADTYSPFSPNSLGQGDAFFVQAGATGAGETYICNTVGPITFGTTAITFAQISSAQVYSAGTGLTLTGTIFSISNTAVTAGTYGSASKTVTLAINAQGQITSAAEQNIAIAASQVTSGTLAVAQGGTNLASYTTGDMLYASGTTTLSKLAIGTSTHILTSSGTAPQWSNPTGITVGTATNSVNAGVTANTSNADLFIPLVTGSTSANYPLQVSSGPTINPSTGKITAGISGGAF